MTLRVNITGNEDAMARDALIWLLCENVVGIRDKISGMNCLKAIQLTVNGRRHLMMNVKSATAKVLER